MFWFWSNGVFFLGDERELHHCKATDRGGLCESAKEEAEWDREWRIPDQSRRPERVCGRVGPQHHDQGEIQLW